MKIDDPIRIDASTLGKLRVYCRATNTDIGAFTSAAIRDALYRATAKERHAQRSAVSVNIAANPHLELATEAWNAPPFWSKPK